MAEIIPIKIPIRSHYKKYCEKEFSTTLTTTDPLGIILYHMLRKNERETPLHVQHYNLNTELTFYISDRSIYKEALRTSLNSTQVYQFNFIIEYFFKKHLYNYLDVKVEEGKEIQESVAMFMGKYNMSKEDLTMDALIKAYYRSRKNKEDSESEIEKILPRELSDEKNENITPRIVR